MDEAFAVHRVRDALVVGGPDRDDAAVAAAGVLRARRAVTCVVVGASAHAAARRLDPGFVAAVEHATSGDLCVVATGFGMTNADRPAPAAGLADRLGVAVTAPVAHPVALADGSLFVAGPAIGWLTFRPGGVVEPVGARWPAPWWQAGANRATGYPVHVPAGLWLRRPDAPRRPDDPLWQANPDLDRMFVVVGAPGEPPPPADSIAQTVRSLPDEERDRAVLACYGSPAAGIAQQVADALGAPIRVAHGVPHGDGLWYVDRAGTPRWRPFAVQSVYRPHRPPALDRWVAPPGLAMAEPGSYRLAAGWRVDVVPRGLAVHPEATPLDRVVLAASTGPTADVVIASAGALPERVRVALTRLIGDLAPEVRANLHVVPVDQPTATALAGLGTFDVIAPPSGPVRVADDSRVHPAGYVEVFRDVAKVFDGADDDGPWFDRHHELVVDPRRRRRLLDFLAGGEVVLAAAHRLPDIVSGGLDAVPASLRSDGHWVWCEAAAYYLDRYLLAPDPALVEHALATASRT